VFVCAQSPLQNSGSRGLAIRLVWWVETDRQGRTGLRGGGEVREAKRGVILSATLVSWEVDREDWFCPVASSCLGRTCIDKPGQAKVVEGQERLDWQVSTMGQMR
jgi:hypothetical protein